MSQFFSVCHESPARWKYARLASAALPEEPPLHITLSLPATSSETVKIPPDIQYIYDLRQCAKTAQTGVVRAVSLLVSVDISLGTLEL